VEMALAVVSFYYINPAQSATSLHVVVINTDTRNLVCITSLAEMH